ncbi:hypothetical protein ACXN1G_21145 [Rhodococcus ruber]|uniref:Ferredoxin n=2 Tax=Rhodococcus TaxID=1827 RepID=M3A374_9NOCA|nr:MULTISPECIES: hypothetical protein [Rhodococcus]EME66899.1 hypothetical protein G352_03144 [Rhodococcus ruber BKS 20-38]KOS57714.1 hypothetical protein Z051_02835 [Rhodococcus rhodochrous KG-21]MDO2377639.1 hypothetical protein [Rhodococcus ruber]UIR35195.1 hypothetical protein LZP97_16190 [Rhodococcus sp. DMF-1]
MQPLQCTECGARVLVAKNSWEHTSVQWNEEARSRCPEMREQGGQDCRPGAPRRGCAKLAETITWAATEGRLTVLDDTPVPGPIVQ